MEALNELTGDEPVNGLRFDRSEYTPFEELTHRLSLLPDTPPRTYNYRLSVRGRVTHDSMDRYLAAKGNSSSLLKEALNSPRHYYIKSRQVLPPRRAHHFELGTFIHSAILEPDMFAKVRVLPDANRSTREGLYDLVRFYGDTLGLPWGYDLDAMKIQGLRGVLRDLESRAADMGYTFIGGGGSGYHRRHPCIVHDLRGRHPAAADASRQGGDIDVRSRCRYGVACEDTP